MMLSQLPSMLSRGHRFLRCFRQGGGSHHVRFDQQSQASWAFVPASRTTIGEVSDPLDALRIPARPHRRG